MKNIKRACILNCTNVKSLKRIVTHNYVDLNLFFIFAEPICKPAASACI